MTQVLKASLDGFPLPPLSLEVISTFRHHRYLAGWLPAGSRLYRYGSDESQARWTRSYWVNVTEDFFHSANEAIEKYGLLDATMSTLQYDPDPKSRKPGAIWNTAGWRGTLITSKDVPVYFGVAGAMDLSTGHRYRGPGDQTVHRCYTGGASQILVSHTDFDKFEWIVPPVPVRWTKWPGHH